MNSETLSNTFSTKRQRRVNVALKSLQFSRHESNRGLIIETMIFTKKITLFLCCIEKDDFFSRLKSPFHMLFEKDISFLFRKMM